MTNDIWLNLPVKEIKRAKAFFTHLGFRFNDRPGQSDDSACLLIGDQNAVVMLFEEATFKKFAQHPICDTKLNSEILISLGASSRAAVDEMVIKVEEAGGVVFGKPQDIGTWMYGCGFTDLDGHRWNLLYMDMPTQV